MKTSQEEEEEEEAEALAPPRNRRSIAEAERPVPLSSSTALRDPFLPGEHIQIETFSIFESFVINTQSHIELHRKE